MRAFESYGDGIPGVDLRDLSGWLIVIEGTDGVGRTTHVNRLRAHLERMGYAVAETGLDLITQSVQSCWWTCCSTMKSPDSQSK